ncbi:MAG: hypothetical protein KGH60_03675 [Candidatus Micrarchaeota archaeon]|nr:hypothetical protein [Candidatus Micrarchaeota archaeon]
MQKTDAAQPHVPAHRQANPSQNNNGHSDKPSLNDLIKVSNNPQAEKIKTDIDELRKERSKFIARAKECRRKLGYKEAEFAAIDKLVKMRKEDDKDGEKRRRFGYLKRLKNKLEFKISTEATSLSEEKELIRKIAEINKELSESHAFIRMERKLEFVKKDIAEYKAGLAEADSKIAESDQKLDAMYTELRKALGIGSYQNKAKRGHPQPKKREHAAPSQDVNLEDIVVIKKKDGK